MAQLLGNVSAEIGQMLRGAPSSLALNSVSKGFSAVVAEASRAVPTPRSYIGGRILAQVPQPITGGKTVVNFDTSQLTALFGANALRFSQFSIGPHPDFAALPADKMLYHHCVSMFVDIKGSTRLVNKLDLPQIRRIKDTLLSACIHVANFFGGHVHRLQGDAAFLQFVRTDQHPAHSIINALNAASVLCHFVSQTLADEFAANGFDPLKIRVGIDYGTDEEVLWSHYGIDGASELTTTSLHTDLAAKLQQRAGNNEVRIGANVVRTLDLPREFWDYVENPDGSPDYYIFRNESLNYGQFNFDWRKFLLSYDFATKNGSRIDINDDPNRPRLLLEVYDGGKLEHIYHPNSLALAKGRRLVYKLMRGQRWISKQPWEVVQWKRENRGTEAGRDTDGESWRSDDNEHPKYETSTRYLGHHYLHCRISSQHQGVQPINLKFPLFIQ